MMLNNTNNFHHQFSFFNFDLNNNSDNNSNNKINNFIKFNKHNNYNNNDNNIHYYHHHCNNNVKNKLLQSPTLPSDVLLEIFKYIEDDKHSLYDCLLVNKNWFQLVAPLLWKRPFVLLKKSNKEEDNSNSNNNYYFDEYLNITCNNNVDIENTENINRSSLIDTYIACSSDDFKSQLFDKFGICLSGQFKNPILNYSTYLRDLDLAELESSIICWLSLSDYCYNVYDVYWELFSFITSEICKMLFVNSNGLWSFSLGSWNEETSTIPNLSSLSSPLMVFRNLKTLEIKGDFDHLNENDTANLTKILELLINNSTKNVEYINIDITGNHENSQTEKLRKLIESQRSLNYFRYSRTNCSEAFSEEYINSCSTQSKSLKKLVFDSVPLSEDSILPLIKCNNLDLLQFNSCYQKNKIKEENVNVNENDNDEIISCHLENNTNNLMKINKLKFLSSHLDSVVTTILYLVNCNLSELTLENPTKAHLEVINRHCTNLNYLALSTTMNTLISSSILLSTTNLKHLVLYLRNYSIKMTEQDLNQLGKNLPISLNTLHLNSIFGYDELEYLLKDFHPNIKSLIITIDHVSNSSSSNNNTLVDERLLGEGEIRRKSHNDNNNQNYYDNYLKVVMNYAKTKHLSEFSYNITKLKNQPSNLLSPEMIFSKGLLNEAKQFIQNISTKSIFPFECDDYEVLCD